MEKPKISIVVAVTKRNAAIGNGGKLLVHISDDLKRFRSITTGHPLIMGRKTFEGIGKPLPNRTNIIITRNPDFTHPDCIVVHSLEQAIEKASEIDGEIFIGGGGDIYKQALPFTNKLYLTLVDTDLQGDVFFPDWRNDFKKETYREERIDPTTQLHYTWLDLER